MPAVFAVDKDFGESSTAQNFPYSSLLTFSPAISQSNWHEAVTQNG